MVLWHALPFDPILPPAGALLADCPKQCPHATCCAAHGLGYQCYDPRRAFCCYVGTAYELCAANATGARQPALLTMPLSLSLSLTHRRNDSGGV